MPDAPGPQQILLNQVCHSRTTPDTLKPHLPLQNRTRCLGSTPDAPESTFKYTHPHQCWSPQNHARSPHPHWMPLIHSRYPRPNLDTPGPLQIPWIHIRYPGATPEALKPQQTLQDPCRTPRFMEYTLGFRPKAPDPHRTPLIHIGTPHLCTPRGFHWMPQPCFLSARSCTEVQKPSKSLHESHTFPKTSYP